MKKTIFSILRHTIISMIVITIVLCPGANLLSQEEIIQPSGVSVLPPGQKTIAIDFNDVDIRLVIRFMSEITKKNFLIDNTVKGTVTIISPTEVPVNKAWDIFLSILESRGYTAIESDSLTKILPRSEAVQRNVEMNIGKDPHAITPDDRIITQLMSLDYAEAAHVISIFRPLISRKSSIVVYQPTNTIIITDTASNIRRLAEIIEQIDIEGSSLETNVIPIKYASASVLAGELNEAIEAISGPEGPKRRAKKAPGKIEIRESKIKIIADKRTNSIILIASAKDTQMVKSLIKELDIKKPFGTNPVHIYYLANAIAEEVAAVLSSAISTGDTETEAEEIKITADSSTNSLIVTASAQDYKTIEAIIKKLDIVQDQVLVEVLIAEVSLDVTQRIGIQWTVQPEAWEDWKWARDNDITGFQSSAFNDSTNNSVKQAISNIASSAVTGWSGLGLGFMQGAATASGIPHFAATIEAYIGDTDVNVLSTPQLLTANNKEAEIVIGQNIPYLKDSRTTETDTVVKTFDYEDVGINLKMTPHIAPDSHVKLDLYVLITDLVAYIGDDSDRPQTTKREITTTVRVKDGHTVVIGGLIKDEENVAIKKIPLLGDLPFVGALFRSEQTTKEKTNLLIFITPHIVTDAMSASIMTRAKREERTKFIKRIGREDHMDNQKVVDYIVEGKRFFEKKEYEYALEAFEKVIYMHEVEDALISPEHKKTAQKYIKKCRSKLRSSKKRSRKKRKVSKTRELEPELKKQKKKPRGTQEEKYREYMKEYMKKYHQTKGKEHKKKMIGAGNEEIKQEAQLETEKPVEEQPAAKMKPPKKTIAQARKEKAERDKQRKALTKQTKDFFARGVKFYMDGKYENAIVEFDKVLVINPDDRRAAVYIKKCRKQIEVNPRSENE